VSSPSIRWACRRGVAAAEPARAVPRASLPLARSLLLMRVASRHCMPAPARRRPLLIQKPTPLPNDRAGEARQPPPTPPPHPRSAPAMAIPAGVNRVLDVAHKITVGVLAGSAVYFTVEIFRASWAIQERKFETRQSTKQQAPAAAAGGGKTA
jgi:hypothetical protein